jgi:chromosome segregation ATPase
MQSDKHIEQLNLRVARLQDQIEKERRQAAERFEEIAEAHREEMLRLSERNSANTSIWLGQIVNLQTQLKWRKKELEALRESHAALCSLRGGVPEAVKLLQEQLESAQEEVQRRGEEISRLKNDVV